MALDFSDQPVHEFLLGDNTEAIVVLTLISSLLTVKTLGSVPPLCSALENFDCSGGADAMRTLVTIAGLSFMAKSESAGEAMAILRGRI